MNNELISDLWNTPLDVGVFDVSGSSIVMEVWTEDYNWIDTSTYYGEILNDTTFLITHITLQSSGKPKYRNFTYRFKPFSPKPDSTNVFIK